MRTRTTCIITGLLILSLTSLSIKAADTNNEPVAPAKAQPQSIVVVCYIGVAVAAGFVVYSVYRCAQAAGLTNPPPPPSPPGTNTSNANIVIAPKDSGPTPPGSTNNYTGTNTYTSGLVAGTGIVYLNAILATNNDASMEAQQDISTNGWTDWQGNPYTWFLVTQTDPKGPHIQTSTNLVSWTDANYSVNIWLSSSVSPDPNMLYLTNIVSILYDGNGIPLVTNWSPITINTPANVGFPATAAKMFFRGVTP